MTTMKRLSKSKEYREGFVASQVDVSIPFQIRALRKKRGMEQKELGVLTGMAQPRISAIESPGYSSFTIDTLKRVAAAFDVALIVRFGSFSELAKQSNDFSPDDFNVPGFDEDLAAMTTHEDQTSTKAYAALKAIVTTVPDYQQTYDHTFVDLSGGTGRVVKERRIEDRGSTLSQLVHIGKSNVSTDKTC